MKTTQQLLEQQSADILQGFANMEEATEQLDYPEFQIITAKLLKDVLENVKLHLDIITANKMKGH